VTFLSCTTETLGNGSPLPASQVPAGTPPTTADAASAPTSRPAPVTTTATTTTATTTTHGEIRQLEENHAERSPVSTSTYPPPRTPTATSIDYGPTQIDPIRVEYALDWRDLVAVWFRAGDVDRVLAIIECESSGRWNAAGPEIKHLGMRALGLMQHLDGYWPARARNANAAGYANDGDIWSPTDQMAVSAFLAYRTPQGFGHWECDNGADQ